MANSLKDSLKSALAGGHDIVCDFYCDLCKELEKQQKEAVEYCSNCREYLCIDCFHHHTRPKPTRHHVLLDQHQMPKDNQTPTSIQNVTVPLSDVEARLSRASLRQNSYVRQTRAEYFKSINIKKHDRHTPSITGCTVLPGDKLVLVDNTKGIVKFADPTDSKIVSRLELPSGIWDIAQVSSAKVAVTYPEKQTIYFVKVGEELKVDRTVNVKGHCYGIARINDNLVVSYSDPVKVEIINMKGKVLQTIITEDKGRQLFAALRYVTYSKSQQLIYIPDAGRGTVTSVDATGRVLATYTGDNLRKPRGLTVDMDGTVYVCVYGSDNIIQLTSDLSEGQLLIQKPPDMPKFKDIHSPSSVCYFEATDRLCVGMCSSDSMTVYQLK